MTELKCPESIEELERLEQLLPLCRKSLYEAAQAKLESGAARTEREASRQLAEETGKPVETIRSYRKREEKSRGEGGSLTPPDITSEDDKETEPKPLRDRPSGPVKYPEPKTETVSVSKSKPPQYAAIISEASYPLGSPTGRVTIGRSVSTPQEALHAVLGGNLMEGLAPLRNTRMIPPKSFDQIVSGHAIGDHLWPSKRDPPG